MERKMYIFMSFVALPTTDQQGQKIIRIFARKSKESDRHYDE